MWRREPVRAASLILMVVLCASCARRYGAVVLPSSGPKTTSPAMRVQAMRRELKDTRDRVRELEQQLAARDRDVAAVRSRLDDARDGAGATAGAAPVRDTDSGSALEAAPSDVAVPRLASAPGPAGQAAAPVEPRPASPPPADSGAAGAAEALAGAVAAAQSADARANAAERQLAKLEDQLTIEVKRREEVEAEMARLLQETSSGPYERASGAVVEQHLREQLEGARREIAELRTTLSTERRERQELERRFAALQVQVQRTATAPADNEEIEALKRRQHRVLASIQQDLQASQQREAELRAELERRQGSDSVSLADEVAGLRTENAALQMRLDQEHRQNRDLSSKLQLATRVTDLIFKMQTAGAQPAAVQPVGGD